MGGGDALMSLLGLVIISFGFRVYTQRDTMKRHFPEIVGATILSSIFSLFSTAFAAKAIGLSAGGSGQQAARQHHTWVRHPAGVSNPWTLLCWLGLVPAVLLSRLTAPVGLSLCALAGISEVVVAAD